MTAVAGGRTVVVVGGGITGLAAAYELSTAEPKPRVVVLEGGDRLGGKVQATPFAGLPERRVRRRHVPGPDPGGGGAGP